MSRSNPTENLSNPCTRWFEWQGEAGTIRYYDKDSKTSVTVDLPFTMILLDQLSTVTGWHDPSSSRIYSNEVRHIGTDVLHVKSFKGGSIAEGVYKAIKDEVNAAGGQYAVNLYCAYKDDSGHLAIGCLRLKGAAAGAWMDFSKAHRASLYTHALTITGVTEGKKGRVVFRTPVFALTPVSPQTDAEAKKLDEALQAYLQPYLAKAAQPVPAAAVQEPAPALVGAGATYTEVDEDMIPFAWLLPLVLPALTLIGGVVA